MRATVMHKAGDVRIENVPDPVLQAPTDAVIRVTRACICGSDLWPYNDLPPTPDGRQMGHEAIGVVEEVGAEVRTVKRGQLVVMPFAFSDGTCQFCDEGLHPRRLLRQWRRDRRRPSRGAVHPAGGRDALRPAGRPRRRADALAPDALRRDGHRAPRRRLRAGAPGSPCRGGGRRGGGPVRRHCREAARRGADHHHGPPPGPPRAREAVRRNGCRGRTGR